ncbi:MAG: heptosyltransferase [Bacteroidetes bacterium HGW-Bacteroidetes-6]|nr:MAG: heptosyltransferase [Bacteroidetes bacterium HGW-Bacteroidetes-6]
MSSPIFIITLKFLFQGFFLPFTFRFIITFAPAMQKILIIQTASLGDVILATALAASIKIRYPDAVLTMLVKKPYNAILSENEVVDYVWFWDKSSKKYRNLLALRREIKKQQFDFVINLHRFASSGFLTAFSGAKFKAGFKSNPFSLFFNAKAIHTLNGVHEIERNLTLGKLCFPDIERANPQITPVEPEGYQKYFENNQKVVCLFPGSLWKTKMLPVEQWMKVAVSLPDDFILLLMGSLEDTTLSEKILQIRPKNTYNICGCLSVNESSWIMKKAVMNYCNDSAPTHLASAVNAPVTTVFCSTVPDFGFTPLSDISFIVEYAEKLACRPCGIHGHRACPEKHFHCGTKIETKQLLEGIKDYVGL